MSLLKPLLLIIALGLVSANHTTDVATSSNSADDKKLVQALISGDATLATLGILKSQLILILKYTETHYVYILPSSHFDSKKTKFYLKGAIKMQTKWPNITKQLAEKYASTDIFLIEDEKHAFFVTFPVGPFSQIAFYRIDNGEFIEIVNDNGTDANQLMDRSFAVLSVDKPYTFYIVPKSKLLWTSLQKVRLMPIASSRLGGLSSVKHSQLIGDQIYLCYTSGGYIQSNASSTEDCPPWTRMYGRIEAGFVWNSRMVIIFRNHTSKKLVVLAFDQLTSGRDRKKATRCSMEEAFIGGKSGDSEDDDGRGAGHLSKGLILGLILLGIILCLAAGLGFWLWHRRRKQVSHKASKKKSSAHRRRSSSHLKKGGRRKSQQMLKRSKSRLAKKGTSKVGRKRSTKRRVSKRRTSKMTTRGPSGSRVKYSRI